MIFQNYAAIRSKASTYQRLIAICLFAFVTACGNQALQAASVNFSSIEIALADPDDKMGVMNALWGGWQTQVYEYNMPFIELANGSDETLNISEFRMSIGDTNYQFSNEFMHKDKTNAAPFPANGEYAILGYSTPDIPITSTVENGGDVLVVSFGNGGLKPGEVVRFQVDINADNLDPGMMYFAPYTEVFFNKDGIAGEVDPNNSIVALEFVEDVPGVSAQLPNYDVPNAVSIFDPRDHAQMQQIDPLPPLDLTVPEPTSMALIGIAGLGACLRRRGSNR